MNSNAKIKHAVMPAFQCSSSEEDIVTCSASSGVIASSSSSDDVAAATMADSNKDGADGVTTVQQLAQRRPTTAPGKKKVICGRRIRPRARTFGEKEGRKLKRSTSLPDITHSARFWTQYYRDGTSDGRRDKCGRAQMGSVLSLRQTGHGKNDPQGSLDVNISTGGQHTEDHQIVLHDIVIKTKDDQCGGREREKPAKEKKYENNAVNTPPSHESSNQQHVHVNRQLNVDKPPQSSSQQSTETCSHADSQSCDASPSEMKTPEIIGDQTNGNETLQIHTTGITGASETVVTNAKTIRNERGDGGAQSLNCSIMNSSSDKDSVRVNLSGAPLIKEGTDTDGSSSETVPNNSVQQPGEACPTNENKQFRHIGGNNLQFNPVWQEGQRHNFRPYHYGFNFGHGGFFRGRQNHPGTGQRFRHEHNNGFRDHRWQGNYGKPQFRPAHHQRDIIFAAFGQDCQMWMPRHARGWPSMLGNVWGNQSRGGMLLRGRGQRRGRGAFNRGKYAGQRFPGAGRFSRRAGVMTGRMDGGRKMEDAVSGPLREIDDQGHWNNANHNHQDVMNGYTRGRSPYRTQPNKSILRRNRSAPPAHGMSTLESCPRQHRYRSLSRGRLQSSDWQYCEGLHSTPSPRVSSDDSDSDLYAPQCTEVFSAWQDRNKKEQKQYEDNRERHGSVSGRKDVTCGQQFGSESFTPNSESKKVENFVNGQLIGQLSLQQVTEREAVQNGQDPRDVLQAAQHQSESEHKHDKNCNSVHVPCPKMESPNQAESMVMPEERHENQDIQPRHKPYSTHQHGTSQGRSNAGLGRSEGLCTQKYNAQYQRRHSANAQQQNGSYTRPARNRSGGSEAVWWSNNSNVNQQSPFPNVQAHRWNRKHVEFQHSDVLKMLQDGLSHQTPRSPSQNSDDSAGIWKAMQLQVLLEQQNDDHVTADRILTNILSMNQSPEAVQQITKLVLSRLGENGSKRGQQGKVHGLNLAQQYLEMNSKSQPISPQESGIYRRTDNYGHGKFENRQGNNFKGFTRNRDYRSKPENHQNLQLNIPQNQRCRQQGNGRWFPSRVSQKRVPTNQSHDGCQVQGNNNQWQKNQSRTQYVYFMDDQCQTDQSQELSEERGQWDVNSANQFLNGHGMVNRLNDSPVSRQNYNNHVQLNPHTPSFIMPQNQIDQPSPGQIYTEQVTNKTLQQHHHFVGNLNKSEGSDDHDRNAKAMDSFAGQQNGNDLGNGTSMCPVNVPSCHPQVQLAPKQAQQINHNFAQQTAPNLAQQIAPNFAQPVPVNYVQTRLPMQTPFLPMDMQHVPVNTPFMSPTNPFFQTVHTPILQPVNMACPPQTMFPFPPPTPLLPVTGGSHPGSACAPNIFQFPDMTVPQQPAQDSNSPTEPPSTPLDKPGGFAGNCPLVHFPLISHPDCLPATPI